MREITEKEKATLKVNVDAANRFIQHALSDAPTPTEPTVTSPSTSKSPGEKSKKNVPASNSVENKNRKKQRQ